MRWSGVISALAVSVVCGAPAAAADYYLSIHPIHSQGGYQKTEVSEAVLGSAPLTVWRNFSLNPDCTSTGQAILRIVHPPEHGSFSISTEPFYPSFSIGNVRYACNKQKAPGNRAIYTAGEGYVGRDHLVLEGSTGTGTVRRISVTIDVR
jgi:hypothetical protein